MLANQRREQIAEYVRKNGAITVSYIMNTYKVSTETVRKDLNELEKLNLLQRVHGGAVAKNKVQHYKILSDRLDENKGRKAELALVAAKLICENDVVAIDAGSTAVEVANAIKNTIRNITVVTYSLEIFEMFSNDPDYKAILIGGEYLAKEKAFYGSLAEETVEKLNFDKAFVFPAAVSVSGGASDYMTEFHNIQKAYIKNSRKVYFLADSTKFETTAFMKLWDLSGYTIITDSELDDGIFDRYTEHGIQVLRGEKR